jgi:hypothetical protein
MNPLKIFASVRIPKKAPPRVTPRHLAYRSSKSAEPFLLGGESRNEKNKKGIKRKKLTYMLAFCGPYTFDRLVMSFCPWGVSLNVMKCAEFNFHRWWGYGPVWVHFRPIAIHWPTHPYNIANTTVQQVIKRSWESVNNWPMKSSFASLTISSRSCSKCICTNRWFEQRCITIREVNAAVSTHMYSSKKNCEHFALSIVPCELTHIESIIGLWPDNTLTIIPYAFDRANLVNYCYHFVTTAISAQ